MSDLSANLLESGFRWLHVLGGVVWVGLGYFSTWVNVGFLQSLDGDTKRRVLPELMPRVLFWFRWGAAITWLTGLLLLGLVYYQTRIVPLGGGAAGALLVTFGAPAIYELAMTRVLRTPLAQLWGGWLLAALGTIALARCALPYRAVAIHLGAALGTIMAFNAWFRIWPLQRRILGALRAGVDPEPAWSALASRRSRHNAFLSIPVLFLMVSQHASPALYATHPYEPLALAAIVLAGFGIAHALFVMSARVHAA